MLNEYTSYNARRAQPQGAPRPVSYDTVELSASREAAAARAWMRQLLADRAQNALRKVQS
jgi:ABC-type molybdate transport system substrate-binding protein